ncbi:MAG: 2-C-methyl-D-erythritol 4-phosphate cytidylyltransferase [Cytophagales bacterium CG18_big_fil_WC_8_21_14_2_50_42_9]|nr:MAG: 2-C-methyl-D-erythritol 4-phosphate cytidylyltransferase [Cytophagales bacterium CG18_big_fil_WC_8_21_14_2_50_42_9]
MSEFSSEFAIIVAGGSGTRMQSQLPKQFISVGGEPILMRTIRRFHQYNPSLQLVVVLPKLEIPKWQALCFTHVFEIKHQIIAGGATRFESVKNGLAAISESEGVVAVHDGVRPFVPVSTIAQAFAVAARTGNAVVAVPLKESIRQVTATGNAARDRSQFRLIQTPQCFRLSLLRAAFALPEEPTFTDDASVVEKYGEKINLVDGSYENIKITTPDDLLWAEAFLKAKH